MINRLFSSFLATSTSRLVLLFFLGLPLSGNAQQIAVGTELSLKNEISFALLGEMGDHFLLFRDKKTEFFVQGFDTDMRKQWEKELSFERKRPVVQAVVSRNEDFSILYTHGEKGRQTLRVRRYDPSANLQDSAVLKVFSNRFVSPNWEVYYSQDETKILFLEYETSKKVNILAVDNNDLSVYIDTSFEPDFLNFSRDLHSIELADDGQLFFLFEAHNFNNQLEKHVVTICHFNQSEQALRQYLIPLPMFVTHDFMARYDELNDQLFICGLYAPKTQLGAEGTFTAIVDLGAESVNVHQQPFSIDFIQDFLGEEVGKVKGVEFGKIQDIILRRDGGAVFIGEVDREVARVSPLVVARDPTRAQIDYYNEQLFVTSVNPDGELFFRRALPKKQFSQDDDGIYSSYFLMQTPVSVRLIFNDKIQKESTVSEYVVYGNGMTERHAVFSTHNLDLRLRFRDSKQVDSESIVVASHRNNRLKLVKIKY